jgi:hypothetical protein
MVLKIAVLMPGGMMNSKDKGRIPAVYARTGHAHVDGYCGHRFLCVTRALAHRSILRRVELVVKGLPRDTQT